MRRKQKHIEDETVDEAADLNVNPKRQLDKERTSV